MRKSPWELLIDGDREAFISIYDTNYQDLFTHGFSICGDKELTKECIQDLFLEFWNTRSQLTREVTNVRSYLFTWPRRGTTKAVSLSAHIKNSAKEGADELLVECGMMLHENILRIQYDVLDFANDFAPVHLDELLHELPSTSCNEQ